MVMLDPRVYFTLFSSSGTFELNLVPKVHLLLLEGIGVTPGINVGLGFSSNLNKWAIRPEMGYDGYFSFGIGVSVYPAFISKAAE